MESRMSSDTDTTTLASRRRTHRSVAVSLVSLMVLVLTSSMSHFSVEESPSSNQGIIGTPSRIQKRASVNKRVAVDPNPDEPFPKVAWLMTFPNSGTTYTLKLIQQYTNTTTATNYGNEQSSHESTSLLRPDLTNGPFARYTNMEYPSTYILTKTHCGSHCILCPNPNDYIETYRSFDVACRASHKMKMIDDGGINKEHVVYSGNVPQRAVHLLRHPLDNIVARLHLQEKRWEQQIFHDGEGENLEEKQLFLDTFNNTREGFHAWCEFQDYAGRKYETNSRFYDEELWEIARQLPCHAELIRYVTWHNLAIEVIRRRNLPVLTMYYESFETDWNATVDSLFDFLNLQPAEGVAPLEFIAGKHYLDHFESHHVVLAKQLTRLLASPEAWQLLEHYFR